MWGLIFILFGLIIENRIMAWMMPENPNIPYGIQIITAILAALIGNSFIRQTGKNKNLEANKDIRMAMMDKHSPEDNYESLISREDIEIDIDSIK